MKHAHVFFVFLLAPWGCAGMSEPIVEPRTTSAPAPAPAPAAVSAPPPSTDAPKEPSSQLHAFGAFSVAEHFVELSSVIASPVEDGESMKAYRQQFATIKRRQGAVTSSAEAREASAAREAQETATLEKFGYRFVGKDLVHGKRTVRKSVGLTRLVVNESGKDAALIVMDEMGTRGTRFLVRNGSISPWETEPLWAHWAITRHVDQSPIFVGDDLLTLDRTEKAGVMSLDVRRGKAVVHTISIPTWLANPVQGFWAFEGHWVLEVAGQVFVDGKSLHEKGGYSKVFNWTVLGGRPFYFFSRKGHFGMNYDGKDLPLEYDELPHDGCCEYGSYNPTVDSPLVQFHARRGEAWYFVEAGLFGL